MRHRFLAVLTASASFAMLLTSVQVSLADAIDGDWCKADGKRMKIRGPEIFTPGGNQTRGDYSRHSFSYVISGRRSRRGRKRLDHPPLRVPGPCATRLRRRTGPGVEPLSAGRGRFAVEKSG